MDGFGTRLSWNTVRAAAIGAVLLAPSTAGFAQSSPFGPLIGNWSGNGTIAMSDGSKERLRCRAKYTPSDSNGLQLSIRCASDSYKFELTSDVTASGGKVTGYWSEESRGINGTLSGTASAGHFDVFAQANGFAASISIRSAGNRQSIGISSESDIRSVTISLSRG